MVHPSALRRFVPIIEACAGPCETWPMTSPPAHPALPLQAMPRQALRAARGVFTDIDDTLTRDGRLEPQAADALAALHQAGVPVVAITGRPMGWSEPFARRWPLAAIVAENGAVALIPVRGQLHIEYAQDEATRARNAIRLRDAAAQVQQQVPGAALARDSAGRVTDIAIDHAEFAHLDAQGIERVVAVMRAAGLQATVSSIHINGWFGSHDKLSGARWIVRRLWARDLDAEIDRWLYVGDSTNDQAMFGRFVLSVGVANLLHFAPRLHTWPRYLADAERGAGFAQVARALLAARA
jgi:HAD superfamily hydrolase (TIGR01484 family)